MAEHPSSQSSVSNATVPAHEKTDTSLPSPESESSGAGHQVPPYSSYTDYLDRNVGDWPEFLWMQVFFKHPGGHPNHTTLAVIDSKNDTLHSRTISIRDRHGLTQVLEHREPGVKTRVIVVAYTQSFSIDRLVVDVLASFYDIDPLVLERHFHRETLGLEDGLKSMRNIEELLPKSRLALLPSEERGEERCIHFGKWSMAYITAMFFDGKDNHEDSTVLIWIRSRGQIEITSLGRCVYPLFSSRPKLGLSGAHQVSKAYISSLLAWTPNHVSRGDQDPHEYLAPLLALVTKIHYYQFRNEMDPRHSLPTDAEQNQFFARWCLNSLNKMRNAFKNLRRSGIGRHPRQTPGLLETALSDLESILSEVEEAESYFNNQKRNELLNAQLKEARKSTETASSVARLTQLAFFFIPLSFVTSVFGMNIKQFNNGNVSLSAFFATAAIMTFLTLFPFLGLIDGEIIVASIKLFRNSPLNGLWFLAFTMSHFRKTNRAFCEERMFYYLSSGHRQNWRRDPDLEDEDFWLRKFGWNTPGRWQRFWVGRVIRITTFIETEIKRPGWKDKKRLLDDLLGGFKWWRLEK